MRKVYTILSIILLSYISIFAQKVNYEIEVYRVYWAPQSSNPDPTWKVWAKDNFDPTFTGGECMYKEAQPNGGGNSTTWEVSSAPLNIRTVTNTLASVITLKNDFYENDCWPGGSNCEFDNAWWCTNNDDDRCQNDVLANISFRNQNPCQWNYYPGNGTSSSDFYNCGKFGIQVRIKWTYADAPSITTQPVANTSVCKGANMSPPLSVIANLDGQGRSMGKSYQWQISNSTECNGSNWVNITGATSATYTPWQISGTRLYRCKVSSHCTDNNQLQTISNCARVTYNPYDASSNAPGGFPYGTGDGSPAIQSGICGSTVLPNTTHSLNTIQPPTAGALANISSYSWSATGGTISGSGNGVSWTAPTTPGSYSIKVVYNDACAPANAEATCTVTVGSPDCDFVYVSPTGVNNSLCGGPNNPCATLTGTTGALSKVGSNNHIRMANGSYIESSIVELSSNIVIEGGFSVSSGIWTKSSNSSTNITCNGTETISNDISHVMGFRSNNISNWKLIDLNITTVVAIGQTSSGRGKSNYGLHISNGSSGYEIIRTKISVGAATNGQAGIDGNSGADGNNGSIGSVGDCGGGDSDGGDGATTTTGGAGGTGPGGNGSIGGSGGAGGAGGDDNGTNTNACTVNRTTSKRNGARGATGGNGGGLGGCGNSEGQNGLSGANGSGNGSNGSDGITGTGSYNTYYTPGIGVNGTGGAGGKGGGGGGGGGWNDCSGFLCTDDGGSGGSSGGSGGGGGGGASAGKGGGSSFGIYQQSSAGNIIASEIKSGTAGIGGTGGTGGSGGSGGVSNSRQNGCDSDAGSGGYAGNGTAGGNGGNGGNGGGGIGRAIYVQAGVNPTLTNITPTLTINTSTSGGSIPSSPIITLQYNNFKICQNSVLTISKSISGSWTLPSNWTWVKYNNSGVNSEYNAGTVNTADITTTNTNGFYNLTANGIVFNSYLDVNSARNLPIITVKAIDGSTLSPAATICNGGSVQLTATSWGTETEYKWEIFSSVNAPNKGLTTNRVFDSALKTPTATLATGTYLVRYQVRESCCGWSIPVFTSITVVADPTAPSLVTMNPTDLSVCVGQVLTISSPSGVTGGIAPYTYEYDISNPNAAYDDIYTSVNNITSTAAGTHSIKVRVQEIDLKGCDASPDFEKTWNVYDDPKAGSVNQLSPLTSEVCEGESISVQVIGASGGIPATSTDNIQYYVVNPSGGAAPLSSTSGSVYSSAINTTGQIGDVYFRTQRTSTGLNCNTSTWSTWVRLYTVVAKPVSGLLVTKFPNTNEICKTVNAVSASFAPGKFGGTTAIDKFEYSFNGGPWQTYTAGSSLDISSLNGGDNVSIRTYRTSSLSGVASCATSINSPTIVSWIIHTENIATSIIEDKNNICAGTPVKLTLQGFVGYGSHLDWFTGTNGSGILIGSGNPFVVTPISDTIYYAYLNGGACPIAEANVAIQVNSVTDNLILADPKDHSNLREECTVNGWTYYSNPFDPIVANRDKWIFAIRKNIQSFEPNFNISLGAAADVISSVKTAYPPHGSYLMKRYWNVELISGSIANGIDIRFYYDPTDLSDAEFDRDEDMALYGGTPGPSPQWFKTNAAAGGFDPSLIAPGIGNNWNFSFESLNTKSVTGTEMGRFGAIDFVQFNGLTSLSGGTGGTSFGENSPLLPVELASFTAQARQKDILLKWLTLSELNNERFDVLRSENAIEFEKIGEVSGFGTTNEAQRYEFIDNDAEFNKLYYYKLNQVDNDGTSEYSSIVSAIIQTSNKLVIGEIIPNPAVEYAYIPIISTEINSFKLQITNVLGQKNYVINYNVQAGNQQLIINVSDMKAGNYIVTIKSEDGVEAVRKLQVIK